jgi:hypothetical protein
MLLPGAMSEFSNVVIETLTFLFRAHPERQRPVDEVCECKAHYQAVPDRHARTDELDDDLVVIALDQAGSCAVDA